VGASFLAEVPCRAAAFLEEDPFLGEVDPFLGEEGAYQEGESCLVEEPFLEEEGAGGGHCRHWVVATSSCRTANYGFYSISHVAPFESFSLTILNN
jgi:hypothetical protein